MKSLAIRTLASLALGVLGLLLLAGATAPHKSTGTLQADKLIIISTTDVKGKTSPCG